MPFLNAICQKMNGKKVIAMLGRTLLTAMIIFGLTTTTTAQSTYHVGVMLGGQYTNMSWDGPTTVKMYDNTTKYNTWIGKYSYQMGLAQELRLTEFVSVELDAMYSDRGAWHTNSDSTEFYDRVSFHHSSRDEDFKYLDGHLLFKINIPFGFERIVPYDRPGKRAFISVYGGPYFGYLMSYTSTGYSDTLTIYRQNRDSIITKGTGIDRTTYTKANFNNSIRKRDPVLPMDIGATFGVGVNFLVGESGTFGLDFRYSMGMGTTIDNFMYGNRSINKADDPGANSVVYNYANVKHSNMFQFLISYKIKLLGRGPNTYF